MGSCCSSSSTSQDQDDIAHKAQGSQKQTISDGGEATTLPETLLLGASRGMEADSLELHKEALPNTDKMPEEALRLTPVEIGPTPWSFGQEDEDKAPVHLEISYKSSTEEKSSGFIIDVQMLEGIGADGSIMVEYC